MQAEWTGRTVIVTGASGNLGAAVARAFAAGGANLVLVDRHLEALQRAGFADDATHLLSVTDLLDQSQVSAMVQAAVAKFGGVHVLCNIAGGFRMGEVVHETSDATWNFLFDINARTLLHAARVRLRPILMTTLAMIFGMLPLALGLSEGSEQRAPMGQAVIGGVITSSLLTLVVVPVIYCYLDDLAQWWRSRRSGGAARLQPDSPA